VPRTAPRLRGVSSGTHEVSTAPYRNINSRTDVQNYQLHHDGLAVCVDSSSLADAVQSAFIP